MAGKGRPAIDLTGQKFGRLTVVKRHGSDVRKRARWVCRCDCGKTCIKAGGYLTSGDVRSCGCLRHESWNQTHGHSCREDGSPSRVYRIWLNMKYRCNTQTGRGWRDYGGRGITYDPRWEVFENFLADMGEPPAGTSLDRIDNDGPYTKDNCRWADRATQRQNSRGNITWVEISGERMPLSTAVKKHGKVSYLSTLLRIGNGWKPIDAVLAPPYSRKPS